MKNLKRLIALVAVFALALTTIASAATFTDVAEDNACYEAVETLTQIGIIDGYEDGTYQPEKVVTRSEMAKLIATMQGFGENSVGASTTKFSDVPASHWASGYIANATGIAINGRPDGTFGPDENVKYEDAVKMIMATLGYTVVANSKGGYPMGYVSAAIAEGVTKNVSNANVGTEANRGTIAQLIYNAIDTPLVEQITWEADGSGEYTKYDGTGNKAYKTLMSENLDVVKMKGVVMANSYMSLTEAVTIDKEDEAKVDVALTYGYKVKDNDFFDEDGDPVNATDSFFVANSDAEDFVGKAVILYAMQNDYDEWEVLSIVEDSTYNKAITFALSDFDDEETDFDNDKVYYFKDGASTSTKVTLQGTLVGTIYNNAYYGGDVETLINNLYDGNYGGQVTLVDTDKTTGYDVIIVEAAVSAVVDEINNTKVMFKDGVSLPVGGSINRVDVDDENVIVVLTKDGEEIDIDEVAEDDVLSIVAASREAGYVVVDVMSNIVEGTVSSKKNSDTSEDGKAYKIDGTWYDVAAGADIGTVNSGDAGRFFIDKYGKIAYYDETVGATGNYGFVIDTLVSEDDWGNLTAEIKLLTAEGAKIYKTTEKFSVDDSDYDLKEDDLAADALEDVIEGQVVDVTFNGEKIKKFITAEGDDEDEFELEGAVSGDFDAEAFEIGNTEFEEDTLVFFVDPATESKNYVGTLADLEDATEIADGQAFYYADDNNTVDGNILVLVGISTSISKASGIAVVVDFEDATDEDENDIYTLTLLYNGEEVVYNTDADVAENIYRGLTIGDIVKIKVTGNNVITALEPVFNFAEDVRDTYTTIDVADYFNATVEDDEDTDDVDEYAFNFGILGTDPDGDNDEYFDGGYAANFSKTGKKITIGGNAYKLSACDNVYVIDNTGREIAVEIGSAADFVYDEKIYEDDVVITDKNDDEVDASDVADIVIFRMYDGDPVEAVIIKGTEDYDWDIAD